MRGSKQGQQPRVETACPLKRNQKRGSQALL